MDTSTKSHAHMEVQWLDLDAPNIEEVFLSLGRYCHEQQQVLQEVVLMDSLDDFQTWLNQKLVSSTNPEQLEVSTVCLQVFCQLGLKARRTQSFLSRTYQVHALGHLGSGNRSLPKPPASSAITVGDPEIASELRYHKKFGQL